MAVATGTALAVAGGLGAVSSIYSGKKSADASRQTAGYQSQAANRASQLSSQQYAQTREDLAPYREQGTSALQRYSDIVLGGDMSQFRNSPGYQFRMGEGVKALERGASARGNLFSGQQAKALTRFGQDYASNDYQNQLSNLYNLSQQGLGAINNTAQFGQQSVGQQGQYGMQGALAQSQGVMGQAQAQGQMGQGISGAVGGGLGAYMGYQQNQQLMNSLNQG